MLTCQIISIGDELLLGDTINTNASRMSKILASIGVETVKVHTVRDEETEITHALEEAIQRADVVLTTGGLGPTHDDKTKKVITDFYDTPLVVYEPMLKHIKETFEKRHIPFSKSNYGQAKVPKNCEPLFNKYGTAPGMWFQRDRYSLAVLPGIPREVKYLMYNEVLPRIKALTDDSSKRFFRYFKTAGIGESTLSDEVLPELSRFFTDDVSVAFLPSVMENMIRITTKAGSEIEADEKAKSLIQYIYDNAGKYVIGEGEELTLSEAVGKLLRKKSLTISTAESCTGGLLASKLTDVPGSSDYMMGGLITYSNSVKLRQLQVPPKMLEDYGAVSKPVALQMAKQVAALMKTDIGLSTTGIAGPGGGSQEKPVGTVWVGFWSEETHFALQTRFSKDRQLNKKRSVALALEMTRRTLLNVESMPYGLKPRRA